jgi:hypothetical protein
MKWTLEFIDILYKENVFCKQRRERFEPLIVPRTIPVFKTRAIDHSVISLHSLIPILFLQIEHSHMKCSTNFGKHLRNVL